MGIVARMVETAIYLLTGRGPHGRERVNLVPYLPLCAQQPHEQCVQAVVHPTRLQGVVRPRHGECATELSERGRDNRVMRIQPLEEQRRSH